MDVVLPRHCWSVGQERCYVRFQCAKVLLSPSNGKGFSEVYVCPDEPKHTSPPRFCQRSGKGLSFPNVIASVFDADVEPLSLA